MCKPCSIETWSRNNVRKPCRNTFDDKGKIFRPVSHINAKWADENDIRYLAAENKIKQGIRLETLKSLNIEIK